MTAESVSNTEMPEITAYSMTAPSQAIHSSAGPFYDEPIGEHTYNLGMQTSIKVWPEVDQETKAEFERQYIEHEQKLQDAIDERLYPDEEEGMKKRDLRVVQIFVADRHPDVPLEKAIVYQSKEPFATDMTNQELYHTINIMDLLEIHNAQRVTWVDKQSTKLSGKEVMLEEIRIRDLDMQVTAFTEFA